MSDRAGRDFCTVDVAYDALDVLILAVDLLHPEDVVTEVEALEPALLTRSGTDERPVLRSVDVAWAY